MPSADHLDKFLDVFLNWQAVLLSFGVFILLGVIRGIGTQKDSTGQVVGGYAKNIWFQRFTPVYPYLIALGLCAVPKMPLPEVVATSLATKLLYGLYTGWLSGFSYQMIKSILKKAGVVVPDQA
jgi:hypothetical protein